MTSASEIKTLLKALNFSLKEGAGATWTKNFPAHDNYNISVDFEKEEIDYGSKITLGDKTTCNFKASENFVVLECVDRLLEKGYKPENFTLEKTWATGHGTSGKLDVFVTHDNGTAYLMIECKTYGTEFDKEFKKVLKDGGQLFTYFQQDKDAEILMLYASRIEKGSIQYRNEIVNIEEDYRQTGNVKDFYDRWNKLPKNNGVFDTWVTAYNFQSKALTPESLKEIKQEDSGFIFNQFLEILRHNVVSDKPNAFNKIFTLFLCKIYDEKATKPNEELAFQWFYTPFTYEGINYPPDDNISFQKRLTDLYKKGMIAFLDKDVTDISDADFERKYGKDISQEIKRLILNDIVEIRLKKNNEFAIKEVFNDDSFVENAKVVKAVVELLQGYKIRYTKKQQYLSDFFELLLTTGLKQESGQFFTPVPIAQFIIKSIPLDKIVASKLSKGEKDNLLPTIIDYAAGSGHFITESMHEVQRIIDKTDPKGFIEGTSKKLLNWKTDHFDWAFQYVYGIEKDYRLVKVGKVGCYLHGDGLAQIIHSDGLGNFSKTEEYKGLLKKADKDFPKENKQFDIVISNPPYSVPAFKNNARKYYTEADFEIYDKLTDQSSEIECLFIERTKQLLKDGGVAGIILPSSILGNTGVYTKAREIILEYFEVLAITELGGNTFMATSTSTVVLFLRRRNNYDSQNIKALAKKSIADAKEVTINGIEKPLSKYVAHVWVGLTLADYLTLIKKEPNSIVEKHELFKEYKKAFKLKTEKDILDAIISLEQEKFFYFVLAYSQKLVLIKTGEKDEEKKFLGYEFSNRRGSEGIHPVQKGKSIDDCTYLFDADVFDNPEKASTYIYQAFQGDFISPIDSSMTKNVSRLDLLDLLTFDRVDFEKSITLSVKKKLRYEEIWGTNKLEFLDVLAEVKKGTSITKDKTVKGTIPVIAGGQEPAYYHNKSNRQGNVITVSASGAYSGFVNYFESPIFASDCNTIQSRDEKRYSTKLLFLYLKLIQDHIYSLQRGQAQPHVYGDDLEKIKIPLLLPEVQKKTIADIKLVESAEKKCRTALDKLTTSLIEKVDNVFSSYTKQKLGLLCEPPVYGANERAVPGNRSKDFRYIRITDINDDGTLNNDWKTAEKVETKYILSEGDFLFARSGATAGKTYLYNKNDGKAIYAGYLIKFKAKKDSLIPEFLDFVLRGNDYLNWVLGIRKGAAQPNIIGQQFSRFEIPTPLVSEQKKIIKEADMLKKKIATHQKELEALLKKKQALLKNNLKK